MSYLSRCVLILFTLCVLYNCTSDTSSASKSFEGFTQLTPKESGIDFVNRIEESVSRNVNVFDYFFNGGGVAIGDLNNDDLPDIIFTGNDSSNKVYFNKGDLTFEDVTKTSGLASTKWSNGVTLVDINTDGYLDIYICNGGPSNIADQLKDDLYINNKNGTFSEQSAAYGLDVHSKSVQAAFFDYDNDGDADLWVNTHAELVKSMKHQEWLDAQAKKPLEERLLQSCRLFENVNNRFVEVTKAAGLEKPSFGLGLTLADINDDGHLDVMCHNDYFIPDYIYINNGDKTFTDKAESTLGQTSFYSMGSDLADINNDGLEDLIVVDMSPADHYRNKVLMSSMDVSQYYWLTLTKKFIPQYMTNSQWLCLGKGKFSEISSMLGTGHTEWSWAPLLADFDNDGDNDMYVTNGFYRETKNNDLRQKADALRDSLSIAFDAEASFKLLKDYPINPLPNNYYENEGPLRFKEKAKALGLGSPSMSNGAAYGDLDGDGDLDLVVNNLMETSYILRNEVDQKYLKVDVSKSHSLQGRCTVDIYHDGKRQTRRDAFTRGYQSYMEPIIHFGLGTSTTMDSMVVNWYDGTEEKYFDVKSNQTLKIGTKANPQKRSPNKSKPLFQDVTSTSSTLRTAAIHKDDFYNDFESEVLLPHKYSTLGAPLAVGDLDGDGKEDFLISGGAGYPIKIFQQTANDFSEVSLTTAFINDKRYEDLSLTLFDADQDGDLDLYAASGGGGDITNEELLQDRLYINQSNFNFTRAKLPSITSSTKLVLPIDYDNDGDLDIFVGGRNVPGKYPTIPRSYFLKNEGGEFKDISEEVGISKVTSLMITDGLVDDVDGDEKEDILLVGEWASPFYLSFADGKFERHSLLETPLNGLWQSVGKIDLDQDGDSDYILGNLGPNNKFTGQAKKKLSLYANDFDDNGTLDIVLAKKYKDEVVPVRGKECSSEQMPFLKEKFTTYHDFASATLVDIYSKDKVESSQKMEADLFHHIVLRSEGDKDYTIDTLPIYSQLGPIMDMVVDDYNGDGYNDIVAVGSILKTEPETRAYGSNKGLVLLGRADGGFDVAYQLATTGIYLSQNTKTLSKINLGGRYRGIIAGSNAGQYQLMVSQSLY